MMEFTITNPDAKLKTIPKYKLQDLFKYRKHKRGWCKGAFGKSKVKKK